MPVFRPFAGLRYSRSVPLDQVIAPPYDVVDAAERAALAARHSANAIHVELPADDPRSGLDRYRAAARTFEGWRAAGTVVADDTPAFYAYRMTDAASGASTTGVISALWCEAPGTGVLPHEQTTPKDKSDRLDLIRACRANLSPIWGLSLAGGLADAGAPQGEPHAQAVDDDGVTHALWVLDDPGVTARIEQVVAAAPVVIADGHHRYETALTYQAERRAARHGEEGDYDYVMAFVVELAEGQLSVGPIHRTLAGVPDDVDLAEVFERFFDLVHAGPTEEPTLDSVARSGALTLVTERHVWLLTPRPETYAEADSDLDSSLVALATDSIAGAEVRYVHDPGAAVGAVLSGDAQAALLLRPVTVAQISQWAHARRRMPPKSTYFHPKPRTGMVFRVVAD
jgi:uncharacterized protein (DUF1015 family)